MDHVDLDWVLDGDVDATREPTEHDATAPASAKPRSQSNQQAPNRPESLEGKMASQYNNMKWSDAKSSLGKAREMFGGSIDNQEALMDAAYQIHMSQASNQNSSTPEPRNSARKTIYLHAYTGLPAVGGRRQSLDTAASTLFLALHYSSPSECDGLPPIFQ